VDIPYDKRSEIAIRFASAMLQGSMTTAVPFGTENSFMQGVLAIPKNAVMLSDMLIEELRERDKPKPAP
jgi:hypothetical protein